MDIASMEDDCRNIKVLLGFWNLIFVFQKSKKANQKGGNS
jgi:hypothetical protein